MTRRPNTTERRVAIADAMVRLLARHGVDGATMQALARETGLTQGLLHYHYASKDEIVLAAVDRLAAGIEARLPANAGTYPLGALLQALLDAGSADEEALRAWLAVGDAAQRDEPIRQAWAAALARLRARVASARDAERPHEARQPDRLALAGFVVAAVEGVWRVGVLAPGVLPVGTAAGTLARILQTTLPAPVARPASPPVARPPAVEVAMPLRARDRRWLDHLVARSPIPLPASVWQIVAGAYTSPDRHYHTLEHLAELADRYAEVAAGPGWQDPRAVWLALLFHDVVYAVGTAPGENERRSAAMLRALLPDTDGAAEIIEATADHGAARTPVHVSAADLAHFLDADLSILGASPARYARYERQIAAEYVPFVGQKAYDIGRSAFLARMAATPSLLRSELFRTKFGPSARRNLAS